MLDILALAIQNKLAKKELSVYPLNLISVGENGMLKNATTGKVKLTVNKND